MSEPESSSNICVLLNPIGKLKKVNKIAEEIKNYLTQNNIRFTVFSLKWPDTFISYSDLWIVGGDGTLNYTLNKYKAIEIPVVIFKGGTGNDFAWQLYGDATVLQQIKIALSRLPQAVDVAKWNEQLYINSAGFGFDGEVLKSMNSIRYLGGHLGYLGVVIRKIFTYSEILFQVRSGDEHFSEEFLLVAINNSSRTGGGFLISPKAVINDGKLDMVLCKKLPVLKRLRYLPVIEKGKHLQLPFIINRQGSEFIISASKIILGQLDGELISGDRFKIDVLPGYIKFRF